MKCLLDAIQNLSFLLRCAPCLGDLAETMDEVIEFGVKLEE